MKTKIFFISLLLLAIQLHSVYAISGTCSDNGGVNCSIGASADGNAICNDGSESSVPYSEVDECNDNNTNMSCTEQDYLTDLNNLGYAKENTAYNSIEAQINSIESGEGTADQTITSNAQGQGVTTSILQAQQDQVDRETAIKILSLTPQLQDIEDQENQIENEVNIQCAQQGETEYAQRTSQEEQTQLNENSQIANEKQQEENQAEASAKEQAQVDELQSEKMSIVNQVTAAGDTWDNAVMVKILKATTIDDVYGLAAQLHLSGKPAAPTAPTSALPSATAAQNVLSAMGVDTGISGGSSGANNTVLPSNPFTPTPAINPFVTTTKWYQKVFSFFSKLF